MLDCCNSLFLNLESIQLKRLQLWSKTHCRDYRVTPILESFHWLRSKREFTSKLCHEQQLPRILSAHLHVPSRTFAIESIRSIQSSSFSTSGHYTHPQVLL